MKHLAMDAASEVINDGVTGYLVEDPGSADQVSKAMIKFLSNPKQTRQMGEAGFAGIE